MIANLIKLGLVTGNTDDTEDFPQFQIQYMDKVADAMILLPYGFPARPIPDETLCLVFNIQGQEQNRIAVPLSSTNRLKGFKDGEVGMHNEALGTFIKMDEEGNLRIEVPNEILQNSQNVTITAADVNIEFNDLTLTGNDSTLTVNDVTITGNEVTLNCDTFTINCDTLFKVVAPDIELIGDVATTGTLDNNGVDVGSTHKHSGVTPGLFKTGNPI